MQHVINVSKQVAVEFAVCAKGRAVTVWVKDLDSSRSTAYLYCQPEGFDTECNFVGEYHSFDKLHDAIDLLNKDAPCTKNP